MRGDQADKLSRCDDLGIFPESWEMPLVAGNQVVGARRVRALQKLVIFRIARDLAGWPSLPLPTLPAPRLPRSARFSQDAYHDCWQAAYAAPTLPGNVVSCYNDSRP